MISHRHRLCGHGNQGVHCLDGSAHRGRNGEYEPQLIKKYQNTVTQDMEEKILSMYAKGMDTGGIESHIKELYGMDISDSTISSICRFPRTISAFSVADTL